MDERKEERPNESGAGGVARGGTEGRAESGAGRVSPGAADPAMKEQEPVVMLAFTKRGSETMDRLASALSEHFPDMEVRTAVRSKMMPERSIKESAEAFTGRWFERSRALIYFGATGIAVRCIAPFVRDKFRDPAVLVLDESGIFCISLLSGHVGGGNELCRICAHLIGAVPVITTATDGRGQFAVDVFAVRHKLAIGERAAAKDVSARLLAGEVLKVYLEEDSAEPGAAGCHPAEEKPGTGEPGPAQNQPGRDANEADVHRPIPDIRTELAAYPQLSLTENRAEADIVISMKDFPEDLPSALHLYPRKLFLGIGCRRGTSEEAIERTVRQVLETEGYSMKAVRAAASIDLKKDEPGLIGFCKAYSLPFSTASARELMALPGAFSSSAFVRKTTGADNVCERSAVWLARKSGDETGRDYGDGGGQSGAECGKQAGADFGSSHLVIRKTAGEGVTVAAAVI